jgi:hypothetical protein
MRELHGILLSGFSRDFSHLKRHALLFDRFYLIDSDFIVAGALPPFRHLQVEASFLLERNLIAEVDRQLISKHYTPPPALSREEKDQGLKEHILRSFSATAEERRQMDVERQRERDDLVRQFSVSLNKNPGFDTVPICWQDFGSEGLSAEPPAAHLQSILRVSLEALPVPDHTCAWQDILDFKIELHDKQWEFRRFLSSLSTKQQTEAEIRDDIEWTFNEYAKAMGPLQA